MIVACPKCKAKYKLDDSKVSDAGIKLRCSKCQTVFKVMKKAEPHPPPPPPAPEPVQPVAPTPPPPPPMPPAPAPPIPQPEQTVAPPPPPPQPEQMVAPPPPPPQPTISEPAPPAPPTPPAPAANPFAGTEILVATESNETLAKMGSLLAAAQFSALTSKDGIEALEIIKTRRPKVAVLDVALPKLLGFELCELIKNHDELKSTHVVLLAAQLNSHRYKRSPENLYGANGYIEVKDIDAILVNLITDLLAGKTPAKKRPQIFPETLQAAAPQPEAAPAPPSPPPVTKPVPTPESQPVAPPAPEPVSMPEPEPVVAPEPAPTAPPEPEYPPEEKEKHEKAQRLARIIVSDIVLYNQEAVTEGVRNNNFYELLAKDINDGRKLYAQRVSEHIRSKTDYLEENLEALVQKKRQELGLA